MIKNKNASNDLNRAIWAASYMVCGAASLAFNHSLVRTVAQELHPLEISALRFLWALPLMLPFIVSGRGSALRTKRHGLHFVTALLTVIMTVFFFIALSNMPMAEATALNFTAPLFTTIIAAFFLKEKVKLARWIATAIGFIGVLVILRPGFLDINLVSIFPIMGAFLLAFWFICVKSLSSTETTTTITIYQTMWAALVLTIVAIPLWTVPSWGILIYSAAMGCLGTMGIVFTSIAFALAEASLVAPLDYLRLPFIAIIAFLTFGEIPDGISIIGALIITMSAIYIVRKAAIED